MGRKGNRDRSEGVSKDHGLRGQFVDQGRGRAEIAVTTEVVGPEGV